MDIIINYLLITTLLILLLFGCSEAATQATPAPETNKTDLTWDKDQWGQNWN